MVGCENCGINIIEKIDLKNVRRSPDGDFCSVECVLEYYNVKLIDLSKGD